MNNPQLWQDVEGMLELGQAPLAAGMAPEVPMARRRRRAFSPDELDARATLQLLRDGDGVLRWNYQPPAGSQGRRRRSYRAAHVAQQAVVTQFRFHDLGGNDITTGLQALDARLTPARGLRRWAGGALQPLDATASITGRVLLLVHGTFSKGDMYISELQATQQGRDLLTRWEQDYSAVLTFDHPTLSVGAWSNAVDLMGALGGIKGPIDVVCHSRGGLVVSWLLRLRALPVERVVFVGSPLTGTSLASPARLRAALDLFANVAEAAADAAGAASAVLPLAAGAAGLARIFGKTLRLGSSLPVMDAAVSLVPGLATQQRTSNNLEVQQLFREQWQTRPALAGVGVYFQPDESAQGWKFWKRFNNIGNQLKYAGADLIFDGPNDLVVDVQAMSQLGEKDVIKPGDFLDLKTSPTVHHTSYFREPRVLAFLQERLK
ncbi:MAG: alpha/beta fold hydrolase [Pseudomonadota bacterium]